VARASTSCCGRVVKVIRLEITVDCDENVTPDMVRDILCNQMWFAFQETTHGGKVHWPKMRVAEVGRFSVLAK
jgi:hypothetical protein